MKKTDKLVCVVCGAAAALLRAGQMLTGFDETRLPVKGNLCGTALPFVLLAAAVYFVLSAWKLPAKRDESGDLAEQFHFAGNMPATMFAVAGSFLTALGAAASLPGGASLGQLLLGLFTIVGALCVLYAVFALYRGTAVEGVALLAPVCCLVAYAIFLYRADASNPVLAQIYVEILAIAALTYSALERAAFAFRNGSPRACLPANAMAAILALAAAAELKSPASAMLFCGWALAELGFFFAI